MCLDLLNPNIILALVVPILIILLYQLFIPQSAFYIVLEARDKRLREDLRWRSGVSDLTIKVESLQYSIKCLGYEIEELKSKKSKK